MNLDDQIAKLLALPHTHRLAYAQPLVRQALAEGKGQAGSGRGALPAEVWAECAREARAGEELDRALGEGQRIGDGSIPASSRVTASEALPIVRAIVQALHERRGRLGEGPVVIEATHVQVVVPVQMNARGTRVLAWRREEGREAVRLSGGWLPRPILVQPGANAGACPLAWAVAAWLQLRDGAGESPSTRMGKLWGKRGPVGPGAEGSTAASEERLVVYRRRGEDGEVEGIAYGELNAKQVAALVSGDGALLPDDEAAAAAIGKLEAAALVEIEQGKRLPGEVDGLDAVWKHLGEQDRSRMSDERASEHKAALELVRHLRSCKASSAEAVRARDKARQEGSRGKVESKLALWLRVIQRLAAADLQAQAERDELERWGGFAAAPAEEAGVGEKPVKPPWAIAGRAAARCLLAGEVGVGWQRWAMEELALRAILVAVKRRTPTTDAGREALAMLQDRTGLGDDQAAADARRARGEAALAEIRIAADERAGLRVRPHATVTAASKDWAGPDVARVLGRGEVAVVAPWPPRVLIGGIGELVAAGYDRLVREEHAIQVTTGRDSMGWAGAENSRLLTVLLGLCAREVAAGRKVPTAAECMARVRMSGARKRPLATWRPVLVPLGLVDQARDGYDPEQARDDGAAFCCEVRELRGDLLIRWRETFDFADGECAPLRIDVTLGAEEWDLELADEAGRDVSIDVLDFPDGVRDLIQDRACGVRDWLRSEREGRSRSSTEGADDTEDTTDEDDQDDDTAG